MPLYRLTGSPDLVAPTFVIALDGWVDAGGAATTAAGLLNVDATTDATFDPDELFDYRARRPILSIHDGRPSSLTWPELSIRHLRRPDGHDVLVLTGPEPDAPWQAMASGAVELARHFGVVEWISRGPIPAAVPHTRAVPILGTASRPGLLRGNVAAGPGRPASGAIGGHLRARPGHLGCGHPDARLLRPGAALHRGCLSGGGDGPGRGGGRHIGGEPPLGELPEEARQMAKPPMPRRPPTTRRASTSSAWSRWSTNPDCRRATISSRRSSASCARAAAATEGRRFAGPGSRP